MGTKKAHVMPYHMQLKISNATHNHQIIHPTFINYMFIFQQKFIEPGI